MGHHLHTDHPGFLDLWNPWMLLAVLAVGYVYFTLVGPAAGRRFQGYQPVGWKRKFYMVTALVSFWSMTGTPVAYYGHADLFSAHMLQMGILYLIFPPLVYLSLPEWLLKPLLDKVWVKRLVYPLTQPLIAILGFNLVFSVYHLPLVFNLAYDYPILHPVYSVVLMLFAFQMWFPVFCPVKAWNRISDLQRLAYIFANGVLLTPACALIIFSKSLIYEAYIDAPQLISWLPVHDDQQFGGVVMKVIQEIAYGAVLAYSFFKWYRNERVEEDYPGDPNSPSARAAAKAAGDAGDTNSNVVLGSGGRLKRA